MSVNPTRHGGTSNQEIMGVTNNTAIKITSEEEKHQTAGRQAPSNTLLAKQAIPAHGRQPRPLEQQKAPSSVATSNDTIPDSITAHKKEHYLILYYQPPE